MHRLVDRTTRVGVGRWDVVDDDGILLGRLSQTRGGRHGYAMFAAVGPDGCDLGRHSDLGHATGSVIEDASGGWPRSPRNPKERYRELYDGPTPPLYPISAAKA